MSGFSLSARFPNASKDVLAANPDLIRSNSTQLKSAPVPAAKSPLAVKFEEMWNAMEGPAYVTEQPVAEERKFRFDYAWRERVALELQGGIYLAGKGGHVSPKGVKNDCDKLNLAATYDWRVFKLATGQITFENLDLIRRVILGLREAPETWKRESARLFALARRTGQERHAEAARKTLGA